MVGPAAVLESDDERPHELGAAVLGHDVPHADGLAARTLNETSGPVEVLGAEGMDRLMDDGAGTLEVGGVHQRKAHRTHPATAAYQVGLRADVGTTRPQRARSVLGRVVAHLGNHEQVVSGAIAIAIENTDVKGFVGGVECGHGIGREHLRAA